MTVVMTKQQQKLKELENAKEEDKAAIRTKWDELSDKQKDYLILISI